ncbi:MAG: HAD-IA family hydrolase [Chloroflexi bacterium]|nr:HAD-IA family hydrolase [Chloroflexota bacterium]
MKPVRAIIYDAGHTLLRPRLEPPDIWDFLGGQLGVEFARERPLPDAGYYFYRDMMGEYDSDARARGFWNSYYVKAMQATGIDETDDNLQAAANALHDWYQQPEQWLIYPEVPEMLQRVQALGLRQGVISDWGTDLVPLLHAHDVSDHLDFVVASAAVGAAKPHPEIFHYALARAGLQADDVLYVGDSYISDVLGARAVGIAAVLIDREQRAPEVDCPVVTSLLDVLELIEP